MPIFNFNDDELNAIPHAPTERDLEISTEAGTTDQFGQRLDQSLATPDLIDRERAERLGLRDDEEGLFGSFGQAVNRTSREVVKGVSKTFGADGISNKIEADLSLRKDLDPVEWSESRLGWFGDSLGMGLTESAGLIAAGAAVSAAGAPMAVAGAVGMAGAYVRLYGENKETLSNMNTMGLTEGEVTSNAIILTMFQSAIEVISPAELGAGRFIGSLSRKSAAGHARQESAKALSRALKTKSGKKYVAKMAREFYKPTNAFSGALIGGAKGAMQEYSEEVIQEIAAIKAEEKSSGRLPTREEIIDRAVIQPLRALPAGALMGGMSAMGQSYDSGKQATSDVQPITKEAVQQFHYVTDPETGAPILNEQTMAEEQAGVEALQTQIADVQNISQEEAASTAGFLLEVAYSLARQTVNNKGVQSMMPVEFLKSISTIALNDNLTTQDLAAIRNIQMDETIGDDIRGQRIMDYIASKYGDKHSYYRLLKQVDQSAQMASVQRRTAEMEQVLINAGAAPLKDAGAVKAFSRVVKSTILGFSSSRSRKALDSGLGYTFHFGDLNAKDKEAFGREQVAQLYAYGASFKHNGHDFKVAIRDDALVVYPATEDAGAAGEVEAQKVTDERIGEQKKNGAKLPFLEETGSDIELTLARAIYAQIANKALGVGGFMEFFSNPSTAAEVADVDFGEMADRTFQDGEDAMTGTEIIVIAQEDAARPVAGVTEDGATPMSLDELTARESAMRGLGEDAYTLYVEAYKAEVARLNPEQAAQQQRAGEQTGTPAQFDERSNTIDESLAKEEQRKAHEAYLVKAEEAKALADESENLISDHKLTEYSPFMKAIAGTLRQLKQAIKDGDIDAIISIEKVVISSASNHIKTFEGLADEAKQKYTAKKTIAHRALLKSLDKIGEIKDVVDSYADFVEQMTTDEISRLEERDQIEAEESFPDFIEQVTREEMARVESEEAFDIGRSYADFVEDMTSEEILRVEEEARIRKTRADESIRARHMAKFAARIATDKKLTKAERKAKNDALRKTRLKEKTKGENKTGTLFQEQSDTASVGGLYIPTSRTAIFFANADAGTVIHELLHHMSAVMPEDVRLDIRSSLEVQAKAYQAIHGGDMHVAYEEVFADSMNQYILNGSVPEGASDSTRNAYEVLKQGMATFTQRLLEQSNYTLAPETQAFVDEFLSEVSTEEIHGALAEEAMTGIQSEGISENQTQEAEEQGAVLMQSGTQLNAEEIQQLSKAAKEYDSIPTNGDSVMDAPIRGSLDRFSQAQADWYNTNKALADKAFGVYTDNNLSNDPASENGVSGAIRDAIRFIEAGAETQFESAPLLLQGREAIGVPEGAKDTAEVIERLRKNILSHLHKVVDTPEGQTSHEVLHAAAYEMFAEEFEGVTLESFSLKRLSYNQVKQLQKRLEPSKVGKVINAEANAKVDELIEEGKNRPTKDHPDKFYDRKRDRFSAYIDKIVAKAKRTNNSVFVNLAYFIRELDGYRYSGWYYENIMKPISIARQNTVRRQEKMKKQFDAIKKKHGVGLGFLSSVKNIELGGLIFSDSQVVLMAMAGRKINNENSHAQNAISESNEVSEEVFEMAVKYVAEHKSLSDHANYLTESYQFLHNEVAPVYFKMTGIALPSIENYFPMIRVDGAWSEKDVISNMLEAVAPAGRSIQAGEAVRRATKKRSQRKGSVIRMDNADTALIAYAVSAANYIEKSSIIKTVSDMVATDKFKDHMRRTRGRDDGDATIVLLNKLVSRELFANGKTTGMDDWQMLARQARNKFTFSMLGGRPMTMVKQTVSTLNFMARLSGAMSPRFMYSMVANSMGLMKAMISNSALNAKRASDGSYKADGYIHLLDGHPLHDMLKEHAPMIFDRHGNPETADFEQTNFRGLLGFEIKGIKLGEFAMGGIKMMDMLAVGTSWLTGFEHITAKELAQGIDPEQARVNAAQTVNEMISDSQPPSVAHERTLGQTDNEFFRGAIPFSAQTMLNWQEWTNGILAPSINLIKNKDVKGFFRSEGYNAAIAQRLAIGFMAPALALGVLARRRWPKDDEEMIADMFFYPLSMTPIFGASIAHGLQSGWREVDFAPVYMEVPAKMSTAAIDFANMLVRDGEFGKREIENLTQATSVILSVPTAYTHFLITTHDVLLTQGREMYREDWLESWSMGIKE